MYKPFIVILMLLALAAASSALSVNTYFFNLNSFSNVILGHEWGVALSPTSVSCLGMLGFCGLLSLLYSNHYFGGKASGLNEVIVLFLSTMSLIILTSDFWSTLVFWEYLGVVSYLLILFYASFDTLHAGAVTLISSRGGDVGLFLLTAAMMVGFSMDNWWINLSLLLVVITKSACFPLSTWLLEAMRAPTPVSCLVHSSTLVAAGVVFMLNYIHTFQAEVLNVLSLLCLISIFISAWGALYFLDLKKIVALSTCNNISWCVLYCCFSSPELCVTQLVVHGIAKCLLFMGIGDVLAGSYSSQNYGSTLSSGWASNTGWMGLTPIIIGLGGAPFNGVFFTKHLLLSGFENNIGILLALSFGYGVFLSSAYSTRLFILVSSLLTGISNAIVNLFFVGGGFALLPSLLSYLGSFCTIESSSLSIFSSLGSIVVQTAGVWNGWSYSFFKEESGTFGLMCFQDAMVSKAYLVWQTVGKLSISSMLFRWEVTTASCFGGSSLAIGLGQSGIVTCAIMLLALTISLS
uniref:NADH:ubiquinone reductase (H(+)-translocating) n=1 Tax=Ancyrocephalus mogurndae TaxID=307077 RepID=A0A6M3R796_9PLAT|nr:NADH dehydrogenase subunit 5 [Ancyrocephalus mogurndae]